MSEIHQEEIYKELESNGIKIGVKKNNIDTKEIVNNIRLARTDIAWIGINIEGTNLQVQIVEATPKPEIITENDYCNIVANKRRSYNQNKCFKWNSYCKSPEI